MSNCRFCKQFIRNDAGIKYGVRHYAHYRCYLNARNGLVGLHDWQIMLFPARLIEEFALIGVAEAACLREKERRKKQAQAHTEEGCA